MIALALLTTSCAHVVNTPLCAQGALCGDYDPTVGYRFHPEWKPNRETFTAVTLSGGGVRASALAYGAMQALGEQSSAGGAGTVLDNIDIMSSVSGGSIAAAWYAMNGPAGFVSPGDKPFVNFMKADGDLTLGVQGLNPVAIGSYIFTEHQRSDVLAAYFAQMLFHDTTYADLIGRYDQNPAQQGYVVLNATDFGHETRFTFTQNNFDLICSDLSQMRLADAASASADFPVFFSPVGIHNNSRCAVQGGVFNTKGPPNWVNRALALDTPDTMPHPNQIVALRAARAANVYLQPLANDKDLHLLDGGLADNLGLQSLLQLDDDPSRAPGLRYRFRRNRPQGLSECRPDAFHYRQCADERPGLDG